MALVTIHTSDPEVYFPDVCPACLLPVKEIYTHNKTVHAPGIRQTVRFPIGYCEQHYTQLTQADKRTARLHHGLLILTLVAGLAAIYLAQRRFPDLKVISGDWWGAWAISTVVWCCGGMLFLAGGTGAFGPILIPVILNWIENLLLRGIEVEEAKRTRNAISIKSFDLPIALVGSPKLKRVTFAVVEAEYAELLKQLNEGTTLET